MEPLPMSTLGLGPVLPTAVAASPAFGQTGQRSGVTCGPEGVLMAIHAGIGAGGGYLYGRSKENQHRACAQGDRQGRAATSGT